MPQRILLIVIDCLRADRLSCHGYDRPTTPTLDALAAAGVRWEQAHSLSSWTRPSVTSLLTGLPPAAHGVFQGIKRSKGRTATTDVLSPDHRTLAESFAAAGWRCAAFINNAQLDPLTGLARGFHHYGPAAGKADTLIAQTLAWLDAEPDRPAFAYLHFLEAHWPYKPRRRHVAAFGGDRDANVFRDHSARDFGRLRRDIGRGDATLAAAELQDLQVMYDGAVRRLDGKIKLLLNELQDRGWQDDTVMAVTADHGDEFLEHGRIGHGHSLYDELVHVPLVLSGAAIPARNPIATVVSHVDVGRTLLGVAGITDPEIPGADLLNGPPTTPVVCELRIRRRYLQALRRDHWKLHRRMHFAIPDDRVHEPRSLHAWAAEVDVTTTHELYNLQRDPGEQHDLAEHAAFRGIRNQLVDQLDAWWNARATCATAEQPIDDQVVNRLRDLGYID